MRVLFNTYPVAFDCPGGGEIQLLKTKKALEDMGIEVKLFDIWRPQFNSVDIVHYYSVQGGSTNFCQYVKNIGLPLVISPIIWLGRDKESYALGEMEELLRICDLALPNSDAEAVQLSEYFNIPREKFFVTRNAVDLSFASKVPADLFRDRFNISGPFILNAANIELRKNQLNLIRAIKGTGLELVILGNIRDRDYFNACMREGEGFVRHLGYLEHGSDMLKSAYSACDLFVLPSLLETPGLSALEAAASGAKIVITGIGCTREYFDNEATYVDPYDKNNIREGIIDEMKIQRDNNLKDRIVENFTWKKTALQVSKAYGIALRNNKGRQI